MQVQTGHSAKARILVVEDEEGVRQVLGYLLLKEGYGLEEAVDVEQAERTLATALPDLILLDWMLPGCSGPDWVRKLRSRASTRRIPVILLTARGQEQDKVQGLESGADDFITKPFSNAELLARIRSLLRRTAAMRRESPPEIGGLSLDPENFRALMADRPLPLSLTEFRLLYFLVTHPDRIYTRQQLLDQVWGRQSYVEERTVDVYIRRLRRALSPGGLSPLIQTVRGLGYRLSPGDE